MVGQQNKFANIIKQITYTHMLSKNLESQNKSGIEAESTAMNQQNKPTLAEKHTSSSLAKQKSSDNQKNEKEIIFSARSFKQTKIEFNDVKESFSPRFQRQQHQMRTDQVYSPKQTYQKRQILKKMGEGKSVQRVQNGENPKQMSQRDSELVKKLRKTPKQQAHFIQQNDQSVIQPFLPSPPKQDGITSPKRKEKKVQKVTDFGMNFEQEKIASSTESTKNRLTGKVSRQAGKTPSAALTIISQSVNDLQLITSMSSKNVLSNESASAIVQGENHEQKADTPKIGPQKSYMQHTKSSETAVEIMLKRANRRRQGTNNGQTFQIYKKGSNDRAMRTGSSKSVTNSENPISPTSKSQTLNDDMISATGIQKDADDQVSQFVIKQQEEKGVKGGETDQLNKFKYSSQQIKMASVESPTQTVQEVVDEYESPIHVTTNARQETPIAFQERRERSQTHFDTPQRPLGGEAKAEDSPQMTDSDCQSAGDDLEMQTSKSLRQKMWNITEQAQKRNIGSKNETEVAQKLLEKVQEINVQNFSSNQEKERQPTPFQAKRNTSITEEFRREEGDESFQTAFPTKLIDQYKEKFEFEGKRLQDSENFGAQDSSQNFSDAKLHQQNYQRDRGGIDSESSQARRGRAMRQASYKGLFKQASVNSGHQLENSANNNLLADQKEDLLRGYDDLRKSYKRAPILAQMGDFNYNLIKQVLPIQPDEQDSQQQQYHEEYEGSTFQHNYLQSEEIEQGQDDQDAAMEFSDNFDYNQAADLNSNEAQFAHISIFRRSLTSKRQDEQAEEENSIIDQSLSAPNNDHLVEPLDEEVSEENESSDESQYAMATASEQFTTQILTSDPNQMTPSQNFEKDNYQQKYVDMESSGEKQDFTMKSGGGQEIILARERVNDPSEFVDEQPDYSEDIFQEDRTFFKIQDTEGSPTKQQNEDDVFVLQGAEDSSSEQVLVTAVTPNKEMTPNRMLKYEKSETNGRTAKPKLSDFITSQSEVKTKGNGQQSVSVFRTGSKKKSIKKSEKHKRSTDNAIFDPIPLNSAYLNERSASKIKHREIRPISRTRTSINPGDTSRSSIQRHSISAFDKTRLGRNQSITDTISPRFAQTSSNSHRKIVGSSKIGKGDQSARSVTNQDPKKDPFQNVNQSNSSRHHQPVTNYQVQQEQARLLKSKAISEYTKNLNQTAFGSTIIRHERKEQNFEKFIKVSNSNTTEKPAGMQSEVIQEQIQKKSSQKGQNGKQLISQSSYVSKSKSGQDKSLTEVFTMKNQTMLQSGAFKLGQSVVVETKRKDKIQKSTNKHKGSQDIFKSITKSGDKTQSDEKGLPNQSSSDKKNSKDSANKTKHKRRQSISGAKNTFSLQKSKETGSKFKATLSQIDFMQGDLQGALKDLNSNGMSNTPKNQPFDSRNQSQPQYFQTTISKSKDVQSSVNKNLKDGSHGSQKVQGFFSKPKVITKSGQHEAAHTAKIQSKTSTGGRSASKFKKTVIQNQGSSRLNQKGINNNSAATNSTVFNNKRQSAQCHHNLNNHKLISDASNDDLSSLMDQSLKHSVTLADRSNTLLKSVKTNSSVLASSKAGEAILKGQSQNNTNVVDQKTALITRQRTTTQTGAGQTSLKPNLKKLVLSNGGEATRVGCDQTNINSRQSAVHTSGKQMSILSTFDRPSTQKQSSLSAAMMVGKGVLRSTTNQHSKRASVTNQKFESNFPKKSQQQPQVNNTTAGGYPSSSEINSKQSVLNAENKQKPLKSAKLSSNSNQGVLPQTKLQSQQASVVSTLHTTTTITSNHSNQLGSKISRKSTLSTTKTAVAQKSAQAAQQQKRDAIIQDQQENKVRSQSTLKKVQNRGGGQEQAKLGSSNLIQQTTQSNSFKSSTQSKGAPNQNFDRQTFSSKTHSVAGLPRQAQAQTGVSTHIGTSGSSRFGTEKMRTHRTTTNTTSTGESLRGGFVQGAPANSNLETSAGGGVGSFGAAGIIRESKRGSMASHTKDWGLLDSEKATFGDRMPKGYEKLSLLGKGGVAIVWLAREQRTGNQVALKQFPKPRTTSSGQAALDASARIEIEIGRRLFNQNSNFNGYTIDPNEFPGIKRIAKLLNVLDESKDVWLSYQVGGKALTSHLFDVKGESYKGERIYNVQHQGFYRAIRRNKALLADLIRMMAEVFDVLAMFRIVHADIKPDNILVDFDGETLKDVKFIDFGSAFSYESPSNISATTPEYLAPEVLTYLENRAKNTESNGTNSRKLCEMQEPWSYDMWSFGAILLEILTGIPLWMSLKCRAQTASGKSLVGYGIFGVQGRQGKKILQKQQSGLRNLGKVLKKYDCYGLDNDPMFMDLLIKMLDPNPISRISPIEVLDHPFVSGENSSQGNAN